MPERLWVPPHFCCWVCCLEVLECSTKGGLWAELCRPWSRFSVPCSGCRFWIQGFWEGVVRAGLRSQAALHPPTEIREAFKVFDRDGNGFISKQELGTAMRSLGYMPNEVELEVIIQRLDMDGDGQVDFEEFVTLLGPKLSTSGIPEKFHGTDFDTVFWKCDMQKLTVDELKRLLYDTFCEHLSMKDIENIIMTEEESHLGTAEECPVDVETCSNQQIRQTCVRKSLICAFAIAFIISVMLIAANQVLRSGMK
ncbi:calcium-binding protein 7 isoform X1 [Loxodonta africana]|uniref:calcium-binding protein 7 isoform X1 n=1 Tax=Loxodonta africana TaxID=9785 RepID=UPI000C812990|nr:calcium-binding protein 7 isoform X1 [Loxodonta africana]